MMQAGLQEPSVAKLVALCKKIVKFLKKSSMIRAMLSANTDFHGLPDLNVIQQFNVHWNCHVCQIGIMPTHARMYKLSHVPV